MSDPNKFPDPPLWIFSLLRRYCPPQLLEEIQGDLMQKFARDCQQVGEKRARTRLIRNALFFLRPGILLRNKLTLPQTTWMLGNYFKVSARQLKRNLTFSFINIAGLALAFCSSLLIFQYVSYELSFDKHLSNRSRIFRVQENRFKNGVIENQWAPAVGLVGPTLKEDFQEIEEFVQVFSYQLAAPAPVVSFEEKYFKEEKTYLATNGFFTVFSGRLLQGDVGNVLTKPYDAVISRSLAERIFGTGDPMGKTISLDKAQDFHITGVFEDFPANTHFHPNLILSMETMLKGWGYTYTWGYGGFHTYILLREGADVKGLESKLPGFVTQRAGEQLKIWDEQMELNLQPVETIHLDSHFIWEHEENGNRARTYFMGAVGLLIVLIAIINYVNLSLAKSMSRAKEVGIRKVVGGRRIQLVQQFMFESTIIHGIALFVGLVLLLLAAPSAARWLGITFSLDFFSSAGFWYGLLLIAVGSTCISAFYPALLYSNYNIISVLKGGIKNNGRGTNFFQVLTVAQISIAVVLMIAAWCVYAQLRFVQQADNGFAKDQILVLRAPNQWDSLYVGALQAFKNDLTSRQEIAYVVATSDVPGQVPSLRAGGVRKISDPKSAGFDCTPPNIDYNYVEMLQLTVLAGRSFSESLGDDHSKALINETALSKLNLDNPQEALGVHITFWGDTLEIIGVLQNYHHESLRKEILPMVFRYNPNYRGYISLKMNGSVHNVMELTRQAWEQYFPGYPFEYFFLDENFNSQYASDEQVKRTVSAFAIIAMFIACIGLFGLSMLTTARRVKEIGIRKVLGATTSAILMLLSRNYLVLLGLSSFVALPAAWFLVKSWLDGFVNHIELSVWYFALPIFIAGSAILVAVSTKTILAARENPVNSLKHE